MAESPALAEPPVERLKGLLYFTDGSMAYAGHYLHEGTHPVQAVHPHDRPPAHLARRRHLGAKLTYVGGGSRSQLSRAQPVAATALGWSSPRTRR